MLNKLLFSCALIGSTVATANDQSLPDRVTNLEAAVTNLDQRLRQVEATPRIGRGAVSYGTRYHTLSDSCANIREGGQLQAFEFTVVKRLTCGQVEYLTIKAANQYFMVKRSDVVLFGE